MSSSIINTMPVTGLWTAWNLKLTNCPFGRWVPVAFVAVILLGHLFIKRRNFWLVSQGGRQR